MQTADKFKSKVILANDPDADRLAVAEKTDRLVIGHLNLFFSSSSPSSLPRSMNMCPNP